MGEGIIVQPAEKWRVLKGNILQCWESNERSKWSSIEKPLWKERGEFGFYVAVRIWDLFSFYSDKTLLGCVFFLFNSNSLYKCYFKLPCVYIIMSFEKKLFFFSLQFYLGIFKDRATVSKAHTLTHMHSCEYFCFLWLRNKGRMIQEHFVKDFNKRECCFHVYMWLCWKFILLLVTDYFIKHSPQKDILQIQKWHKAPCQAASQWQNWI